MDLTKELNINPILLSVLRKEYYNESIFELMKGLKDKKLCYVTLNKPSDSLQRAFSIHNIPINNMFFIDAVSQGIGKGKDKDNTILVSSPFALTELSIAIGETLKTGAFDALLFDSLSTLKLYEMGNSAGRFTSNIMNKIKMEDRKGVFTCLEEDTDSDLIKDSCMNVDKVLNLDSFNNALDKKRTALTSGSVALIGLLAVFSFFTPTASPNSITGFSIVEAGSTDIRIIFPILIALTAISIFAFKTFSITPIEPSKLVKIKPSNEDSKKLKVKFKNKISHWLGKK